VNGAREHWTQVYISAWMLVYVVGMAIYVLTRRRERDSSAFRLMRKAAPKQFNNGVWISRINGILVSLMCAGMLIGTPLGEYSTTGEFCLMLFMLPVGALGYWFALSWLNWGWRTSLSKPDLSINSKDSNRQSH
jgi:hypothetical protein